MKIGKNAKEKYMYNITEEAIRRENEVLMPKIDMWFNSIKEECEKCADRGKFETLGSTIIGTFGSDFNSFAYKTIKKRLSLIGIKTTLHESVYDTYCGRMWKETNVFNNKNKISFSWYKDEQKNNLVPVLFIVTIALLIVLFTCFLVNGG